MVEFNKNLLKALEFARDFALYRHHPYMTTEHVLYGLLRDEDVKDVLYRAGIDPHLVSQSVMQYLDLNVAPLRQALTSTPQLESLLMMAKREAMTERRMTLSPLRLFYAYRNLSPETPALMILSELNVPPARVRRLIQQKEAEQREAQIFDAGYKAHLNKKEQDMKNKEKDVEAGIIEGGEALSKFARNLNKDAATGKIDPVIGRTEELKDIVRILGRRNKPNPVLVGEPGVGKTAIAEGLAKQIVDGKVPEHLQNTPVFALDVAQLIAGTQYRGQFEERLKNVLAELKEIEEEYKVKPILFIDEIHTIMGAGASSGGTMDMSNILKPALARGDIACLGATTHKEYKLFMNDPALARRLEPVTVGEPSAEDTVKIFMGIRKLYESKHKVGFPRAVVEEAVRLAARYVPDRQFPDKALDILDDVGAHIKCLPPSARPKRATLDIVRHVVARKTGIPLNEVVGTEAQKLYNLELDLKKAVFQQDAAIEALSESVKMARAGLRTPGKPVGCYLFTGPTGVGKTEVTKQLSETLGLPLIRLDMSEYMERHAVSRLTGAPPGYVGFDQGGQLTEAVNRNKQCVVLFDEIEKAHPDIYNILLQVMDHGFLTASDGQKVDFRNVILVMTSNAGTVTESRNPIGFGARGPEVVEHNQLEQIFRKEFINRLDAIVPFAKLQPETMGKVVDKFIGRLQEQLALKNVTLKLTDEARSFLAKEGYDPEMGARPMERTIDKFVKKQLVNELLFGALKEGGQVTVSFDQAAGNDNKCEKGALAFNFEAAQKEAAKPRKARAAKNKAQPELSFA